jgi:hypothetical protein
MVSATTTLVLERCGTGKMHPSLSDRPHSIHNRVRLPAAGCMGGLGVISVVPSDRFDKAAAANNIGKQDRRSNNDKTSHAKASSLLHQRRRDWQEAFRSMFHSWTSRLKSL